MNAITEAMMNAGIAVPSIKERLWRAIKERPGITAKQCSAEFKDLVPSTVSSQLAELEARGMVYTKTVASNGPRGRCKAYFVMSDTYVLRKPHRVSAAKRKVVAPAPAPAPIAPPSLMAKADPVTESTMRLLNRIVDRKLDEVLEQMTVREARDLYERLKKMFT